jgi:preprotein translocase subunit SecA
MAAGSGPPDTVKGVPSSATSLSYRRAGALADEITRTAESLTDLSDTALADLAADLRRRARTGETLEDLLVETFALASAASRRHLGLTPYREQLAAGVGLHAGAVVEMKTGEGKTLASLAPILLNALTGAGVHVVTANEYLAQRDADEIGGVLRLLGFSVGCVTAEMGSTFRRIQYACDVTYSTAAQLGFDYLRDNLVKDDAARVQRERVFALVDEVDAVLVDDARTPLIIAAPDTEAAELFRVFAALTAEMHAGTHYEIDYARREVTPLEPGYDLLAERFSLDDVTERADLLTHLRQALLAKELYQRDRQYVVVDGRVEIVDSATGRILAGRRWAEGLHQAVEAKEGVEVLAQDRTVASISIQQYFRGYEKLAGMTGTLVGSEAELGSIYGVSSLVVPTHRPVIRVDHPEHLFPTEAAKLTALVDLVAERHRRGQPVLLGTVSVTDSEKVSALLLRRGIPHQVLNAKLHAAEAEVIAQAGRPGAVTVAANMAGRGVDIKLGGDPDGLLAGVDSEEDDSPVEARRERIAHQCQVEAEQVRALGGLLVVASSRHETRRIDAQLRGRAGRQGDPGESIFFVSLEDHLLRDALGETGLSLLGRGGRFAERAARKVLDRAQTFLEDRGREARKKLLEFDEVLATQREFYYATRRSLLASFDADAILDGLIQRAPDAIGLLEAVDSRRSEVDAQLWSGVVRATALHTLDEHWVEFLNEAEDLRDGIGLRGLAGLNVLSEWGKESSTAFQGMIDASARRTLERLSQVSVTVTPRRAS